MAGSGTVLVTLHGIGFEHPPTNGTPGYADHLHSHLHDELQNLLSDDPNRSRQQAGEAGAIYVASNYAANQLPADYVKPSGPGLARLGTWREGAPHEIDHNSQQVLVDGDARFAHIALVYTNLEGVGLHPAALLETSTRAAFSLTHYASAAGAVRLVLHDAIAMIKGNIHAMRSQQPGSSSLIPRRDIDSSAHQSFFRRLHPRQSRPADPSGPLAVWDTIQDDIATYVCRNDIREDVHNFVYEALLRICSRDDVDGVVVNAHSQGTVVAYDVLRELPNFASQKVRAFVTAGSPLRKYVDCFTWGNEVGCIGQIKGPVSGWFKQDEKPWAPGNGWINFWDDTDPVADPLSAASEWDPGKPVPEQPDPLGGLFQAHNPDTGEPLKLLITDCHVDNWQHSSGGGLQSHNYWDNQVQFVQPLSTILRSVSPNVNTQGAVG